jgi:hypothetical protein
MNLISKARVPFALKHNILAPDHIQCALSTSRLSVIEGVVEKNSRLNWGFTMLSKRLGR